jgi:hypothetical protein
MGIEGEKQHYFRIILCGNSLSSGGLSSGSLTADTPRITSPSQWNWVCFKQTISSYSVPNKIIANQ